MEYNFNVVVDRKNTLSTKYDTCELHGCSEEVIPLWVADMDFQSPPCVIKALQERVNHGVFGYSHPNEEYYKAYINWMEHRHNWSPKKEWHVFTPSVVFALRAAILALTKEGDSILIQQPVYTPFSSSVVLTNRNLVINNLLLENGKYIVDFADFETKIKENQVKLFILCSPHNPVGRVWTKEELTKMADICVENNVIIVADEIHQDFIYRGHKHHVLPAIKKEYENNVILCTSPTKTFNLAGLQISNIIIPNEALREQFKTVVDTMGCGEPNVMGLIACQAAYSHGEAWLEELLEYLQENIAYVRAFLSENLPMLKMIEPEGTYLLWVDFSKLKMTPEELDTFLKEKAKIWLNDGAIYGDNGKPFQRINIGTNRDTLEKGMNQLKSAIDSL